MARLEVPAPVGSARRVPVREAGRCFAHQAAAPSATKILLCFFFQDVVQERGAPDRRGRDVPNKR